MNLLRNKNNVITYTVNKAITSNLYISVQNGEVVINAPWYTTSNQIQKVVEEKKQWILNKIKEYEMSCEQKKLYTKIKTVKVLGKQYDLLIQYKNVKTPTLDLDNNEIKVLLPNKFKKMENTEIVNILMNKMYEKIAEKEIERSMEKARILLDIAPEDYEIIRIENILGKCKDSKITINPEIVIFSREIIDYIVLHEFCHLKYKNHTKSFYNMLKTYIPNYEEIAKELNGMAY
ncbi:MAG: M48 family metallopeptidase [Clostridiaceae bacterium]|nr:M48 family metallopeptidase [Clostridiaceae bacterium]